MPFGMAKAKHEFVASQEALNGPEITLFVVDHTGKDKQFKDKQFTLTYVVTHIYVHICICMTSDCDCPLSLSLTNLVCRTPMAGANGYVSRYPHTSLQGYALELHQAGLYVRQKLRYTHTYTHTHTSEHISNYIFIFICMYVCVRVYI